MNYRMLCVFILSAVFLTVGCSKNNQDELTATLSAIPLINPNTADPATLKSIPGLPEVAVNAIVAGRPFSSQSELHDVLTQVVKADDISGIYNAMFIKVDLNTASEADLKLIPSTMSPGKLAHEFDEYRPYENIEQFRREIGKYVDAKELAHLERYVTLN